jgi:GAF domain-containing protein
MTSGRSHGARTTGTERLRGLLDAQRVISADLSLSTVLGHIVRTACELLRAQYGALSVVAPDGTADLAVHHGALPTTRRLAGDGGTLAVPVPMRGSGFGQLHLTAADGETFDAEDEELATALAAWAGSAIENTRLYEQARRSRDWLDASGEITRALLAEADNDVLADVVALALDVGEADYAALILPTADGDLEVAIADGAGAADFRGRVFRPDDSPLGRAIVTGRTLRTANLRTWAKAGFVNRWDYGPAMLAPLVDAQGVRGAVLLIRTAGRPRFTARDVHLAGTFATQVALALELNDARADAESLRVLADRHRIALDLHDNVMQRLFATGVGLQSFAEQLADPASAERVHRYVNELDETIAEIRTRIFGLRIEDPDALRHRPERVSPVRLRTRVSAETGSVVS